MAGASSRLLSLLNNPTSLLRHRPFALFRLARRRSLTFPLTTVSAAADHRVHLSGHNSLIPIKLAKNFYSRTTYNALQENNQIPANDYHAPPSHPWIEWNRLLESLSVEGYFNGRSNIEEEFAANENLSMEFVAVANSCLAFARDRPDILRLLPRKDIEVLIEEGYPFLFKNADETERRMRSFLQVDGSNEASSVDLMKYILSYASNPIIYPERNIKEATESSVRSLVQKITNLSYTGQYSKQFQAVGRDEQMPRNLGPDITMKRCDWICPKCNFMNFARDTKCLECEELRPQGQLTDGEWDCPQCNFFNYRRNMVCLNCKCRRPNERGEIDRKNGYVSFIPLPADMFSKKPEKVTNEHSEERSSEKSTTYVQSRHISDVDKEEKSERWFKKAKELHGEPNEVPLPGSPGQVKTPSERQQIGSHYRNNYNDNGILNGDNNFRVQNKNLEYSVDRNSNQFFSNTSSDSRTYSNNNERGEIDRKNGYVSFIPLPADMFSKKPEKVTNEHSEERSSEKSTTYVQSRHISDVDKEEKSERWFKKAKELHGVTGPISDFPQIMPTRNGGNGFVDGVKKDWQFSSYRKQQAIEQGVPFPPDYFAKKDNQLQPERPDSMVKPAIDISYGHSQVNPDISYGHSQVNPDISYGHPQVNPDISSGHPQANPAISYGHPQANPAISYGHPQANPAISYGHPQANPAISYGHPQANPAISYGHPQANPAISYGHPQANPAISYGHPQANPAISYGHPQANPAISYGHPQANPAISYGHPQANPAISYGHPQANPAISYGHPQANPAISYGHPQANPAISYGHPQANPAISYGHPQANPAISYGHPQANPAISYGHPQANPAFSYGHPQANPAFSYGHPQANPAISYGHSQANPAISYGHSQANPDISYGHSQANPDISYGHSQANPDISYGHSQANPAISYGHSQANPAISYGHSQANPAISYGHSQANPDISYGHSQANPDISYGHSHVNPAISSGHSHVNSDISSGHLQVNQHMSSTNKLDSNTHSSSNHFTRKETINLDHKTPENQSGWTGKSLEGSAVTEPDPLDMSEEAKAERWFRRVDQIKDISELSQIPDEDFPSIMPVRKGVNRFVVSKRKTPLERRLAYHEKIMSSDPMKKEGEDD